MNSEWTPSFFRELELFLEEYFELSFGAGGNFLLGYKPSTYPIWGRKKDLIKL